MRAEYLRNHVFDHMKLKRKRTYLFQVLAGHFGLRENSVGVLIFVLACSLLNQSIFLTFSSYLAQLNYVDLLSL